MKKNLNFDILESLRGFAALYVCIGHCRGVLWIGGDHYLKLHPKDTLNFSDYLILGLNMLTRLNPEFVIVFFCLSGFSIAHSLRKNTQPVPFYKRRFTRLYPPYISALLWAMFVMGCIQLFFPQFTNGAYKTPQFERLAASRDMFDFKIIFQNLFYMPKLGGILTPFWSLTLEVVFYILAPFLLRNKKLFYSLSILMFLLVNLSNSLNWFAPNVITKYFYFNIFFAAGSAIYSYYEVIVAKLKLLTTSKAVWIAASTYIIMIPLSITGHEVVNSLLAALLSITLIIYLLSNNIRIKWLLFIGRFSYTLYITHFPTIFLYLCCYYFISNAAPPYIFNNLLFIPCIFVCLGVAYVQYILVEKKSKQLLTRLRQEPVMQAAEEKPKPVLEYN